MAPILRRTVIKKRRSRVFQHLTPRHLSREEQDEDWGDGVLEVERDLRIWPLFGDVSARVKPIVEGILRENYTLIKRVFRRVVTSERGPQVARHLGFASLDTVIEKAWGASPIGMEGLGREIGSTVFGFSEGKLGDSIIKMNANLRLSIRQWISTLLHEAIHSVVTLRKRALGAALDHRCMIALGENPKICFPK